jgi:hypothetical protein
MKTREQLLAEITPLRDALDRLDRAERDAENKALIGKCFRYRNSYSLPKTERDYWWTYRKVTALGAHGRLRYFEFQTDKNGAITIEPTGSFGTVSGGWSPIPEAQFDRAWKAMQAKVANLKP